MAFEQLKITSLYHYPEHSLASPYLSGFEYPWEALDGLKDFIRTLGKSLPEAEYDCLGDDVYVAKTAKVAPTAFIGGPCIISDGAEIRLTATENNVTIFTSLDTVKVLLDVLDETTLRISTIDA